MHHRSRKENFVPPWLSIWEKSRCIWGYVVNRQCAFSCFVSCHELIENLKSRKRQLYSVSTTQKLDQLARVKPFMKAPAIIEKYAVRPVGTGPTAVRKACDERIRRSVSRRTRKTGNMLCTTQRAFTFPH